MEKAFYDVVIMNKTSQVFNHYDIFNSGALFVHKNIRSFICPFYFIQILMHHFLMRKEDVST